MQCPLPRYYLCHTVLALLLAVTLWPLVGLRGGLVAGVMFYAGREFTQWEQGDGPGLPFDWKGILVPFFVCAVIFVLTFVIEPYL